MASASECSARCLRSSPDSAGCLNFVLRRSEESEAGTACSLTDCRGRCLHARAGVAIIDLKDFFVQVLCELTRGVSVRF